MSTQYKLLELVSSYRAIFPADEGRLKHLAQFLQDTPSLEDAISRKNAVGHVTASALILSRHSRRILLVHKPVHKRLLQPGGHILPTDATPRAAALRHAEWRLPESFVKRLEYVQCDYDPLVPLDIDIHQIAVSSQDAEPSHLHYDFRYLFLGEEGALPEDDDKIAKSKPEWRPLEFLKEYKTFNNIVPKIVKFR